MSMLPMGSLGVIADIPILPAVHFHPSTVAELAGIVESHSVVPIFQIGRFP